LVETRAGEGETQERTWEYMPSSIEGFRLAATIGTGWEEAGVATREDSVATVLSEVCPMLALPV
jgi:hypothetical protein